MQSLTSAPLITAVQKKDAIRPLILGSPLLTIAIPTYNRSRYLRQCLESLIPQVVDAGTDVRVLVLDNQSTDETPVVLEEFASRHPDHLEVSRNSQNIGADGNIAKCYMSCETTYVWIFGDDDILMPGALTKLLARMKEDNYGLIHLKAFSYKGDVEQYRPRYPKGRYEIFTADTLGRLMYEACDMFSFISGNIINKSLVPKDINPQAFIWTRYNQIQWTFGALFAARRNLLVDDALLAINNEGQSGGYSFCQTFGTNYNVLFRHFEQRGVPRRYFDTINQRMARELFAPLIYFARTVQNFRNYTCEDHFAELKPSYGRYWEFWFFVVPMCKLPKALLYPHFLLIRMLNRLYRIFR